mmetsp:Transcript_23641/g.46560  ORF Transcript_23641/g.46560 Transcript_23641/m.46560 type:complete len:1014 (+) Transcript_23641:63-3104(+)|eukprot:CAMPEP_0175133578 /NCGR_PEP_ID=MMETSP0087-20121206/7724_1 /TAXON_ID=136419 /ORGANISM="Unknown Unknown, Strain D1" /LENGTH=1013 /DNA_ID=CAMNT_0016416091 /DNA_START=67 /DNA_END=3108 /DNA_ORIENTATION=-
MKFRDQLSSLMVHGWDEHYLDYEMLKDLVESLWEKKKKQKRGKDEKASFAERTVQKIRRYFSASSDSVLESPSSQRTEMNDEKDAGELLAQEQATDYGSMTRRGRSLTNNGSGMLHGHEWRDLYQEYERIEEDSDYEEEIELGNYTVRQDCAAPAPTAFVYDKNVRTTYQSYIDMSALSAQSHSSHSPHKLHMQGYSSNSSNNRQFSRSPWRRFRLKAKRARDKSLSGIATKLSSSNSSSSDEEIDRIASEKLFAYAKMGLFYPNSSSADDRAKRMRFFDQLLLQVNKVDDFYQQMEENLENDFHALEKKVSAFLSTELGRQGRHSEQGRQWSTGQEGCSWQGQGQSGASGGSGSQHSEVVVANGGSKGTDQQAEGRAKDSEEGRGEGRAKGRGEDREEGSRLLRSSFYKLYRRQHMLLSFVSLNSTGLDKVIKTFDKRALCNCRDSFRVGLSKLPFYSSTQLKKLVGSTIYLFASTFMRGNTGEAEHRLINHLKPAAQATVTRDMAVGVKYGSVLSLGVLTMYRCMVLSPSYVQETGKYSLAVQPIYQASAVLIILLWLWGLSIQCWNTYQVNYVYIYEFNPKSTLTAARVMEEACNLSLLLIINLTCFLHLPLLYEHLPLHFKILPKLFPYSFFLFLLFKGGSTTLKKSRRLIMTSIGHVLISPFGRLRQRDILMAEVLTSLGKVGVDMLYVLFYLGSAFTQSWGVLLFGKKQDLQHWDKAVDSGFIRSHNNNADTLHSVNFFHKVFCPLVIAIPLTARMLQCLQQGYTARRLVHVVNSAKYMLALVVVVLSAIEPLFMHHHSHLLSASSSTASRPSSAKRVFGRSGTVRGLWLVACALLSLFSSWWDTQMDWGLQLNVAGRGGSGGGKQGRAVCCRLRHHLVFYRPWIYYLAICVNLPLRFVWCLTISVFDWKSWQQSTLLPVILAVEVIRRMLWQILVVENLYVKDSPYMTNNIKAVVGGGHVPVQFVAKPRDGKQADSATSVPVLWDLSIMFAIVIILGIVEKAIFGA